MVQHSPQNFTLLAFLLLQYSLLVSGIIVSQPSASSVWAPGKTYSIKVLDEHRGKTVKGWQVDLMVLGGECDGICLHDGIAAEIAKGYNTRSSLQFTVPADLIQHGKGFQVQFSNARSPPIYHSELFTIEQASSKRSEDAKEELQKRDLPTDTDVRKSENAAPFVLPAVLATTVVLGFSCVFAFFMI